MTRELTTDEIDRLIHEAMIKAGSFPSTLGYMGYPKSSCTSVNNILGHGIPDDRPLEEGDIVNIDVTVYFNGYHGDCNDTFAVGAIDADSQHVINMSRQACGIGISQCRPGAKLSDIGNSIEPMLRANNCSTALDLTGHGIGTEFHHPPVVLHCMHQDDVIMTPGMIFTIEPIVIFGPNAKYRTWKKDGWTLEALAGVPTAACENTVLITDSGVEILTQ